MDILTAVLSLSQCNYLQQKKKKTEDRKGKKEPRRIRTLAPGGADPDLKVSVYAIRPSMPAWSAPCVTSFQPHTNDISSRLSSVVGQNYKPRMLAARN